MQEPREEVAARPAAFSSIHNFQEFREAVGISSYQELHYDLIQEQLVELEQANA